MSVNYNCYVVRGWRFPPGCRSKINELTNYKYEDDWKCADNYTGNDCDDFLGETVADIPLGESLSLTTVLAQCVASIEFPYEKVRAELKDTDFWMYVEDGPYIYIVNTIW